MNKAWTWDWILSEVMGMKWPRLIGCHFYRQCDGINVHLMGLFCYYPEVICNFVCLFVMLSLAVSTVAKIITKY